MATIAIIAPGSMGSAVGSRLVENGVSVTTLLAGRSAGTAERARKAGMAPVEEGELAESDFILSIVPPAEARSVAERLVPMLLSAIRKPIYVDLNAVSPDTAKAIAAVIAEANTPFIDGGIIGAPPQPRAKGPVFYGSGPDAWRFAAIADYGLDARVLEGPIGAASALKMSYAGITKGLDAIVSVMILAAAREGASEVLQKQLAESEPALFTHFERRVPKIFPKAYRWVAEMEEIADFLAEDATGQQFFDAAARLYERLAADNAADGREARDLIRFFRSAEHEESLTENRAERSPAS